MVALDEQMIERRARQLARDGYCVIPKMVHDFRLELEFKRCRHLVGGRSCRPVEGGLLLDPAWQHNYDIPSLLAAEQTVEVLERLGVTDARLVNFRCLAQPPGCESMPWSRQWQPWEQYDVYFFFNLHVTRERGCLRVVPGQHQDAGIRLGLRAASYRAGESSVLVVPGEIVVMNSRLPVSTHPNGSGRHSGFLVVSYAAQFGQLSAAVQMEAGKEFPSPPRQWWAHNRYFARRLWGILAPSVSDRPFERPAPYISSGGGGNM